MYCLARKMAETLVSLAYKMLFNNYNLFSNPSRVVATHILYNCDKLDSS